MQLGKKKLGEKLPTNTIAPDFSDDEDDDDTISSLKANLRDKDDDERHEEYGRKLQAALNEETKDLSPQSGRHTKNPIPMSTFHPPARSGSKSSVQPSVTLDERNDDVVEISEFEANIEENETSNNRSSAISPKLFYIFCIIDFFFAVFGLATKLWWLGFGVLFAPIGLFGFFKLYKRIILVYLVYLATNILLELIFALIKKADSLAVIFTLLVICVQGFIMFFVYKFYQILPD